LAPRVIPAVVIALALGAPPTAASASGEAYAGARLDYALHCMGCHRADGAATPGKVPALRRAARFLAAEGGRAYLVQVPGAANAPLDDAGLARVLNWILTGLAAESLPSGGFTPYTPQEVARLRDEAAEPVSTRRRALLESLQR